MEVVSHLYLVASASTAGEGGKLTRSVVDYFLLREFLKRKVFLHTAKHLFQKRAAGRAFDIELGLMCVYSRFFS